MLKLSAKILHFYDLCKFFAILFLLVGRLAYLAYLLLLCGFGDGLVVEIIDHHWWFAMLGAERIVITHIAEAVRLAIRAQLSVPCIFIINWSIYSFIFRW